MKSTLVSTLLAAAALAALAPAAHADGFGEVVVGIANPLGDDDYDKAVDTSFKLDEQQAKSLQAEFGNLMAQTEFGAYLSSLRNRYKVSVNKAVLEAK